MYAHQDYKGKLSFATDAWTSSNHKSFVVVTIHFKKNGAPIAMLLNLVQVTKSHTGVALTAIFAKILNNFGIAYKVCQ